jgi:hypothetical protein
MNGEPVKIYRMKTEYEKVLFDQYSLMFKEAERYRELSEKQAELLREAAVVVRSYHETIPTPESTTLLPKLEATIKEKS